MPPISGSTSTADGAKSRMVSSCNGCRALRKGCSDDCAIRPCLQWIKSPEAQGMATVFLAKFYGRAGLLNLIAAAPGDAADRRQAVFRSLLYEACGRIVNPVYGAVGLLWSGDWEKCVDAVEAVLRGELALVAPVDAAVLDGDRDPTVQVAVDVAAASSEAAKADVAAAPLPPRGARPGKGRPPAAYDIRHIAKDSDAAVAADLLRFARAGRTGFKRAAGSSSSNSSMAKLPAGKAKLVVKGKGKGKASSSNVRAPPSPPLGQQQEAEELVPVPMVMELEHDGGHDHHLKGKGPKENTDVEAASQVIQAEAEPPAGMQVLVAEQEEEEVGLELTLGF